MENKSKEISYLLRHNPRNLKMDKEGYVNVYDLLNELNINMDILMHIVKTNDKQRFIFSEDGTKIRATQGHSSKLGIKIKYSKVQFPKNYYHGTAKRNVTSIMQQGLIPKNRDYVHLSQTREIAEDVGMRYAKREHNLVILIIDGGQMVKDGLDLFVSDNSVILSKEVNPKYISIYNKFVEK